MQTSIAGEGSFRKLLVFASELPKVSGHPEGCLPTEGSGLHNLHALSAKEDRSQIHQVAELLSE
jgi:hypothetical protein